MTRRLFLVFMVSCGGAPAPPATAIQVSAADTRSESPEIYECVLQWEELAATAPTTLPLLLGPVATLPDDCDVDFDPMRLLDDPAACREPTCERAVFAGGRQGALLRQGPGGSGRFWSVGLVVADGQRRRFVCMTASTVGWRHLHPMAAQIGPLQWLADLDGDGAAEVIIWQRLPWGYSEASNALVPIIYVLDGERLVRSDRSGVAVAATMAAAYRSLAVMTPNDRESVACYRAVADALDHWGER
ncbi:MAG: hypothetical protein H0T76_15095 [Nannocystis sp.]|nr:hypothetical protein [Nannocystis sp.]MBA3547807.1 hypothetical protein [Nannocystis sp.]